MPCRNATGADAWQNESNPWSGAGVKNDAGADLERDTTMPPMTAAHQANDLRADEFGAFRRVCPRLRVPTGGQNARRYRHQRRGAGCMLVRRCVTVLGNSGVVRTRAGQRPGFLHFGLPLTEARAARWPRKTSRAIGRGASARTAAPRSYSSPSTRNPTPSPSTSRAEEPGCSSFWSFENAQPNPPPRAAHWYSRDLALGPHRAARGISRYRLALAESRDLAAARRLRWRP